MNILILAAGNRPFSNENEYPLFLTEFNGIPLIQLLIEQCTALAPSNIIVALQDVEVKKYHLDNIVRLLIPNGHILKIHSKTKGAACTALLGSRFIDNDDELLILNGNELLDLNFSDVITDFHKRTLDAGVIVFDSVHPRYSYVRLDSEGYVSEAAEKCPISRHATAGFYWYKKGSNFISAAKNMMRKDVAIDGNYFICPAFNELILNQLKIGVFPIDVRNFHPLKTDKQFELYGTIIDRKQKND